MTGHNLDFQTSCDARNTRERYEHRPDKPDHRWCQTKSRTGCHGGKIEVERPRLRGKTMCREETSLVFLPVSKRRGRGAKC